MKLDGDFETMLLFKLTSFFSFKRNFFGIRLLAYLQPFVYMLQAQPKEKEAPHFSILQPFYRQEVGRQTGRWKGRHRGRKKQAGRKAAKWAGFRGVRKNGKRADR